MKLQRLNSTEIKSPLSVYDMTMADLPLFEQYMELRRLLYDMTMADLPLFEQYMEFRTFLEQIECHLL